MKSDPQRVLRAVVSKLLASCANTRAMQFGMFGRNVMAPSGELDSHRAAQPLPEPQYPQATHKQSRSSFEYLYMGVDHYVTSWSRIMDCSTGSSRLLSW